MFQPTEEGTRMDVRASSPHLKTNTQLLHGLKMIPLGFIVPFHVCVTLWLFPVGSQFTSTFLLFYTQHRQKKITSSLTQNLSYLLLNSPHISTPSSCLQHESWDLSNSTPISFFFFPSRELERCTIWFQAPAQLLPKTVGKHQGIRWICGTNSCPVMSAERAAAPFTPPPVFIYLLTFLKHLLMLCRLAILL